MRLRTKRRGRAGNALLAGALACAVMGSGLVGIGAYALETKPALCIPDAIGGVVSTEPPAEPMAPGAEISPDTGALTDETGGTLPRCADLPDCVLPLPEDPLADGTVAEGGALPAEDTGGNKPDRHRAQDDDDDDDDDDDRRKHRHKHDDDDDDDDRKSKHHREATVATQDVTVPEAAGSEADASATDAAATDAAATDAAAAAPIGCEDPPVCTDPAPPPPIPPSPVPDPASPEPTATPEALAVPEVTPEAPAVPEVTPEPTVIAEPTPTPDAALAAEPAAAAEAAPGATPELSVEPAPAADDCVPRPSCDTPSGDTGSGGSTPAGTAPTVVVDPAFNGVIPIDNPAPGEGTTEVPAPVEVPVPVEVPAPVEVPVPVEAPGPVELLAPADVPATAADTPATEPTPEATPEATPEPATGPAAEPEQPACEVEPPCAVIPVDPQPVVGGGAEGGAAGVAEGEQIAPGIVAVQSGPAEGPGGIAVQSGPAEGPGGPAPDCGPVASPGGSPVADGEVATPADPRPTPGKKDKSKGKNKNKNKGNNPDPALTDGQSDPGNELDPGIEPTPTVEPEPTVDPDPAPDPTPTDLVKGGPIQRATIITRAISWVTQKVPYSQVRWWTDKNGRYRQDCSGYVSMAWNLSQRTNYWTGNLAKVSHRIPSSSLKPGDILLWPTHHTLIFAGWSNTSKTRFNLFEEYRTGKPARYLLNASLSYYLNRGFGAYRYDNVKESASVAEVKINKIKIKLTAGGSTIGDDISLAASASDLPVGVDGVPWSEETAGEWLDEATPPATDAGGVSTPDAVPDLPVTTLVAQQAAMDRAAARAEFLLREPGQGGGSAAGSMIAAGLGLLFLAFPLAAGARTGVRVPVRRREP